MSKLKGIKSNIKIGDIKSSYFIKELFSFLKKNRQLNMVIYNKELQKKLLFNIEDYKRISGKNKIGDKNGKGKEYILNTNILIFEGEYLNGKKMEKEKKLSAS